MEFHGERARGNAYMYGSVYVCGFICMYGVCVSLVFVCVCMFMYIWMYVCINGCMYAYMYLYTYVFTRPTRVCLSMYVLYLLNY